VSFGDVKLFIFGYEVYGLVDVVNDLIVLLVSINLERVMNDIQNSSLRE